MLTPNDEIIKTKQKNQLKEGPNSITTVCSVFVSACLWLKRKGSYESLYEIFIQKIGDMLNNDNDESNRKNINIPNIVISTLTHTIDI